MSTFVERANSKWEGVDRAELKQDAETLGVELKGNWSDETARLRLCAAVGDIAPVARDHVEVNKQDRPTVKPNLTTIGQWGGRCRDVAVQRPAADNSPGAPVAWDEMRIYIPFDAGDEKLYTIPEPHYNVLMDAKIRHFKPDARVNDEGVIVRNNKTTEEQAFAVMGGGRITPGTEHLPGSLLEWYQWEAERKNYFKTFKKARLDEIYSELTGRPPGQMVQGVGFKEWDREKVRTEVLRFLGLKYVAQIQDSEEDPELIAQEAAA